MSAIELILDILMVIAALVMIVTVLMQSSEDDGLGALTGGMGIPGMLLQVLGGYAVLRYVLNK